MSRRSTPLIGVGAAALAVGALATFAGITSDKDTGIKAGPAQAAAAEQSAAGGTELKIPEGRQAIAVALDPVAGTAGVARAGSHVDVFAAVTKKDDKAGQSNAARMIIQNVEVLRVDSGVTADGKTPATSTTFVLAVTPTQAEKLVYHAAFSRLWFSVVPSGQAPVPPTPGVSTANELTPEAA